MAPTARGRKLLSRSVAFIAPGADHPGGFELDELLEHELHRLAHEVHVTTRAASARPASEVPTLRTRRVWELKFTIREPLLPWNEPREIGDTATAVIHPSDPTLVENPGELQF